MTLFGVGLEFGQFVVLRQRVQNVVPAAFFAQAPYHAPDDPFERILAYVALRKSMISDDLSEFTCLAGTMAQELHARSPDIRDACGQSILGHAATLVHDIEAARESLDHLERYIRHLFAGNR